MESEIGHLGYSITLKSIPAHFLENIRTELYVLPIANPNFPTNDKPYPVFRISKSKVYLPRYYGIEKYGLVKNTIEFYQNCNLEFNGNIRDIQQQTIDATLKTLDQFGGGLISLDTGLGKTVVALKLISLLKVKTLIIVHAEFLLEQWIARIKQFLPEARIGVIRQEKCEYQDVDITVAMLQSIIKREDYPKDCFKEFGLTVIDECHHIGSKTFSSIFYKVQTKYMIGLSATPERKDGLSKVIYWFLGPQIIHIKRETNKPSIKIIQTGLAVIDKFNKLGKINNPTMITDLTVNKERNDIIINVIKDYLKFGRKILVLSDRRNHCEYLLECLKHNSISAGIYLGGMKTQDRELSVKCSVILGTYQASGEGFDVPELDTLILATPKSDIEQAVGRILRQKNENDPVVIDITDSFSIFKAQSYKRKKFYKANEYKVF